MIVPAISSTEIIRIPILPLGMGNGVTPAELTETVTQMAFYSGWPSAVSSWLTMQMSLDWWNFDEAVLGFFLHCAAVAGLLIAASYYTARQLRRVGPASPAAIP